jgi:hypothetical protein
MITAICGYPVDWNSDGSFGDRAEDIASCAFEPSREYGRESASRPHGRSNAGNRAQLFLTPEWFWFTITTCPAGRNMAEQAGEKASRKMEIAGLAVILVAVLIIYRGAFDGYFVQDDFSWLQISQFTNPGELLKCFVRFNAASTYRPLSQEAFFWLARKAFGLVPQPYHAVSLFSHLLSAGLVYCLLRKFTSTVPSLTGAFLFGLHGAHFRSVYWISAFPEPLALVFYLSSILCFIEFERRKNRACCALSILSMVLGVMSKESILTLPCVLALYCLVFARARLFWTVPHFVIGGSYLVWRLTSESVSVAPYALSFGTETLHNLAVYLAWTAGFTESIIHLRPIQRCGIGYASAAMICAAGFALMVFLARRRPLALFGIGWFAIALQPVLYFRQHIYSYYLGPAMVGLAILAAAAIPPPRGKRDWLRWGLIATAAACLLVVSNASVWREGQAWNERSFLAREVLRQMPTVESRVPPGHIAFLFGLGEWQLGALEKDYAFRVFGFPPERFLLVGVHPETPDQIRRLDRSRELKDYYCFVYERGVFQDRTDEFRGDPGRFLPQK